MLGRLSGVLVSIGVVFSSTAAEAGVPGWPPVANHCEVTGCGSNTPDLFGTPIIGLNLAGKAKGRAVTLEPELLRVQALPPSTESVTDCPQGALLGIDRGRLVGKLGDSIVCQGSAMLGMAIYVNVEVMQGVVARVGVRISEASQVLTWDTARSAVPTYRLAWYGVSKLSDVAARLGTKVPVTEGDSICPMREAWMDGWQKGARSTTGSPQPLNTNVTPQQGALSNPGNDVVLPPPGYAESQNAALRDDPGWHDETDHLLIVQGETYREDGSVDPVSVDPTGKRGAEWFNLACVGTSIAKMRLLGYDPMSPRIVPPPMTAREERQATLKMLTAHYLASATGAGDTRSCPFSVIAKGWCLSPSYTRPGMPLQWERFDRATFAGEPSDPDRILEAYWGANGALCVSHRRTWRRKELLRVPDPGGGDRAVRGDAEAIALVMPELEQLASDHKAAKEKAAEAAREHVRSYSADLAAEVRSLATVQPPGLAPFVAVPPCDHEPPAGTWYWVTHAVDHVSHSR